MRLAFWLITGLLACSNKKSPCDTTKVRVDESTVIEIPVSAEYCLYAPDTGDCCKREGTNCDALAKPPHVFLGIERPLGCGKDRAIKPPGEQAPARGNPRGRE